MQGGRSYQKHVLLSIARTQPSTEKCSRAPNPAESVPANHGEQRWVKGGCAGEKANIHGTHATHAGRADDKMASARIGQEQGTNNTIGAAAAANARCNIGDSQLTVARFLTTAPTTTFEQEYSSG
jgi:hypothetical protein